MAEGESLPEEEVGTRVQSPSDLAREMTAGVAQRIRATRVISLCAGVVSLFYTILHGVYGVWALAIFNFVFLAFYAAIYTMNSPARVRVFGIVLTACGTIQLAGQAFLFIPPTGGTHFFLLVIPIFSLMIIHGKDRSIQFVFTVVSLALLGWFEWQRDRYVPVFVGYTAGGDDSPFRGLAAFLAATLSFGVFASFYRDLWRAREQLRASHARSESLLRNVITSERQGAETQLEFFARVSHEFRTPLATITAANEGIRRYRHKMDDEQFEARFQKISDSVQELKALLDETSDFSRIRSDAFSSAPTTFDIIEVLRDLFDTCRSFGASETPGELSLPSSSLEVTMDETLFRHLVANLVSNAFKYAGQGSVKLELIVEDDELCVRVVDTGIGMSDEDLEQVFKPFHRGRNVAAIRGTGLGMNVVKEATAKLGGSLELESVLGEGTTATLRLPMDHG